MQIADIAARIRDVPDFPKPGIIYKDITPLLADPAAFSATIHHLAEKLDEFRPHALVAIESRGFIFAAALARQLSVPMHLVRKRGKLPRQSISVSYELEYGVDHLEMHTDAVQANHRYVIVDDLIATGGTAAAAARMVKQQAGQVVAFGFVVELTGLNGRAALGDGSVVSLIQFD